jgi:hypothetical protein
MSGCSEGLRTWRQRSLVRFPAVATDLSLFHVVQIGSGAFWASYLSIYLSIYLSVYLSIHPSIHLSVCLSIHPSIHLSVYLLSIYLSVCLLSIYIYVCLSIYLSIIYISPIYPVREKRPGSGAHHSPPSRAVVKNSGAIATLSIFIARWLLIKGKGNLPYLMALGEIHT